MSGAPDPRATRVVGGPPPPSGLDRWLHDLWGVTQRPPWLTGKYARRAQRVFARSQELAKATEAQLDELRRGVAQQFRRKSSQDPSMIHEGLAIVAETAARVLGLRPRLVQLMGALALQDGYLIEMATGEGKSLTACIGAALMGWTGRPCHVLTVNDYLAARDADEMRACYVACGLTVASVTGPMERPERQQAYGASVVYTTATELLADFLRDRLQLGDRLDADRRLIWNMVRPSANPQGVVLRGIDTVLVDEADSVLIDEAVTPLIISIPTDDRTRIRSAREAVDIAAKLHPQVDYRLDQEFHEVRLEESGIAKIDAAARELSGVWRSVQRRRELVTQVLTAREFHRRGQQYVVEDGKVVIVDDFTGRLMPDRTWSHGVHQAVEALEDVEVTSPTQTLARLSFQRFFRMFRRVCGMTGTAREVVGEVWHVYDLPVVKIPTHAPDRRVILPERAFASEDAKLDAIVSDVARWHQQGRPVLCGTRRVASSERLAQRLEAARIPFKLLNATKHREEAQIVAQAGQAGTVTIATNMAGRGTDIKLGPGVAEKGGLHVIVCEHNESRRIDRQLEGRSARQGDPGSAQSYTAPEDELLRRYLAPALRGTLSAALSGGLPGCRVLAAAAVARAQRRAQELAYAQRMGVMQMDEWLEDALSFAGRSI